MTKKPPITDKDLTIFQRAMTGIKPLKQRNPRIAASQKPIPPKLKSRHPAHSTTTDTFYFSSSEAHEPVRGEDFISFKKNGVPDKTLRKLRKGQYTLEATLDLHGMTIENAKEAINDFLHTCLHNNLRVVLIIHGKGSLAHMPILKNKLNVWLRHLSVVLAFCTAIPADGGSGAVYAILKSRGKRP